MLTLGHLPGLEAQKVWVGMYLFLVIFMIAPGLFNCCFGREFLFGASRCELAADSAPDCTKATVITLEPPLLPKKETGLRWWFHAEREMLFMGQRGLRHAIYENRDCVPSILEWLEDCNLLARKEDPSEKMKRKEGRDAERDVSGAVFDYRYF
jgi:hypothetical protein